MSREVERKRLVKLIEEAGEGCAENWARVIADYLLDNGVIVPPCKVDDTIYKIFRDRVVGPYEIRLLEVDSGVLDESGMHFVDNRDCWVFFEEFGKTVFLSKAEAEYALKNRRSVSLVNGHIEE